MIKLDEVEFPSKFLNCYESVLVTLLKSMGVSDETQLMGTRAYFMFQQECFSIAPRFNRIDEEWERLYGLALQSLPITQEKDLRCEITAKLDCGIPVCLPVDIYELPHTPHHKYLHQYHYIDIFGYDDGRYYMVCPYYRYKGWVSQELVHTSFFLALGVREYISLPIEKNVCELRAPHEHNFLLFFQPGLKLEPLTPAYMDKLVEENCLDMLGLATPNAAKEVDQALLGLTGIHTVADIIRHLITHGETPPRYILLNLSRQLLWISFSRYWFHQLIQTYQEHLMPAGLSDALQKQFETVIQTWRMMGARVGSDTHSNDAELLNRIVSGFEWVYRQEERLAISLLGALPTTEHRAEILASLQPRLAEANLAELSLQTDWLKPSTSRFVAPRTPIEELLAKLWAQVLGVEQVGMYDNFFDLGGDSLLMAQVHGKLRETWPQEVSMVDLFKYPTVSSLARYMGQPQEKKSIREHAQERSQKYHAALRQQKRLRK